MAKIFGSARGGTRGGTRLRTRATALPLLALLMLLLLLLPQGVAHAQGSLPVRQVIANCWRLGAINEFMMFQCTGLSVPPPVFAACMGGGPCFGEPGGPVPAAGAPGPACGAPGLPFCPRPSPCGFTNTISCPPPPGAPFPYPPFPFAQACGAPPFPPCGSPQRCGLPTTFACAAGPPAVAGAGGARFGTGFGAGFDTWQPTLQLALPGTGSARRGQAGDIRFAEPIAPDLDALARCRTDAADEDAFMACMVDDAFPESYRITRACLQDHPDDAGAAFVCSTGDDGLAQAYTRARAVQACAADASDKADVADCIGQQVLGENERYYANCVARNSQSASAAIVCALAKDLTPEQQIALDCAVTTGGEPHAFAACAGGRLTAREIGKCWDNGIATDQGCFGPNNEIRKYWNTVDDTLKHTFGENSEAYKAFVLYKNNVAMPGPGHEAVRAINTVMGDLQHGAGDGNDIVNAGRAISGGVQSVANAVTNALGLQF